MRINYLFLLYVFLLFSCSEDEPPPVPVPIIITINTGEDENIQLETEIEDFSLRNTIELYQGGEYVGRKEARVNSLAKSGGSLSFQLDLIPGNYDLLCFMDYTPKEQDGDYFYISSNLKAVTINTDIGYTGNIDTRQVFFTNGRIIIEEDFDHPVVTFDPIQTPIGKYKLIATDLPEYLLLVEKGEKPPLSDLNVKIIYQGYLPAKFNVEKGNPIDAITGISFISKPVEQIDGEIVWGEDCIFVNGEESAIDLVVEISDKNGELVNRSGTNRIPVYRGGLTCFQGPFLTAKEENKGIIIDPNYEGEFFVEF